MTEISVRETGIVTWIDAIVSTDEKTGIPEDQTVMTGTDHWSLGSESDRLVEQITVAASVRLQPPLAMGLLRQWDLPCRIVGPTNFPMIRAANHLQSPVPSDSKVDVIANARRQHPSDLNLTKIWVLLVTSTPRLPQLPRFQPLAHSLLLFRRSPQPKPHRLTDLRSTRSRRSQRRSEQKPLPIHLSMPPPAPKPSVQNIHTRRTLAHVSPMQVRL